MPSTHRRMRRQRADFSRLSPILREYYVPAPPSAPCESEDDEADVIAAIWDFGEPAPASARGLDYCGHPYIDDWLRWLDALAGYEVQAPLVGPVPPRLRQRCHRVRGERGNHHRHLAI